MNEVAFELETNEEIWELIDKQVEYIFIPQFNPATEIRWWKADLKINGLELKNANVRQMTFDLQTNLTELKEILKLNTYQFSIYQFEKPVPHTLMLEQLSDKTKYKILQQNGLKHVFWINFEFISISSFDSNFIKGIKEHSNFAERIIKRQALIKEQNQ